MRFDAEIIEEQLGVITQINVDLTFKPVDIQINEGDYIDVLIFDENNDLYLNYVEVLSVGEYNDETGTIRIDCNMSREEVCP